MSFNEIGWVFAFVTFAIGMVVYTKMWVNARFDQFTHRMDEESNWRYDTVKDLRHDLEDKIKDLSKSIDACYANKSMSQNYYNSSNEKCCKTAKDYIQG
jgi:hypothetical protein